MALTLRPANAVNSAKLNKAIKTVNERFAEPGFTLVQMNVCKAIAEDFANILTDAGYEWKLLYESNYAPLFEIVLPKKTFSDTLPTDVAVKSQEAHFERVKILENEKADLEAKFVALTNHGLSTARKYDSDIRELNLKIKKLEAIAAENAHYISRYTVDKQRDEIQRLEIKNAHLEMDCDKSRRESARLREQIAGFSTKESRLTNEIQYLETKNTRLEKESCTKERQLTNERDAALESSNSYKQMVQVVEKALELSCKSRPSEPRMPQYYVSKAIAALKSEGKISGI